jgi:hypothetical protein
MTIIGIDNGNTGAMGVIYPKGNTEFYLIPVREERDFQKEEHHLHRIDIQALLNILGDILREGPAIIYLERPLLNPKRWRSTYSATRALEATLIAFEFLGLERDKDFFFIDSKTWQKEYLASNVSGSEELKKASMEVACAFYPEHEALIRKHKDGDALLLARYVKEEIVKS